MMHDLDPQPINPAQRATLIKPDGPHSGGLRRLNPRRAVVDHDTGLGCNAKEGRRHL